MLAFVAMGSRAKRISMALAAALIIAGVSARWWWPALSGGSGGADSAGTEVTFTRDVAPILLKHCAPCHRPGESAPFPLLAYGDARKRSGHIARLAREGVMPPWLPEGPPGEFLNDRRLSETQIAVLERWAQQGAPEGDPAVLPAHPAATAEWPLGKPDLVVTAPQPVALPSEGEDVYRNLVIPVALDTPRLVRAVEIRPGNAKVVHHALLLVDRTNESRRLDDADAAPGFGGMSTGFGATTPEGQFLGWQPGRVARANDEGAWELAPGSDLVLQLHMRPSGKPEEVQPSIGFYFTDKAPAKPTFVLGLRSTAIDIPAGAASHAVETSYWLPTPIEVLALLPHAHYLGKRFEAWAIMPDGSKRTLLSIPRWNFDWQGDYQFAKPVALPRGSSLHMRWEYDNSGENPRNPHNPPQPVTWGPQTGDEMGELWLQLRTATPEQMQVLREDYVRNWATPDTIALLERRLRSAPQDLSIRSQLAGALASAGKTDAAREQLDEVFAHDPDHAAARYVSGLMRVRQGNTAGARADFEMAVRSDPTDFRARNNLGLLLLNEGDAAVAETHLLEATRLAPNDARSHANLGQALAATGKTQAAIDAFETALRLDPQNSIARQGLRKLRGG